MSEPNRLTDEQVTEIMVKALSSGIRVGHPYRHKKSQRVYTVILVSLREDDLIPLVCYANGGRDSAEGVIWCRPLAEFLEKFDLVS